jgi:hypothetical protein
LETGRTVNSPALIPSPTIVSVLATALKPSQSVLIKSVASIIIHLLFVVSFPLPPRKEEGSIFLNDETIFLEK